MISYDKIKYDVSEMVALYSKRFYQIIGNMLSCYIKIGLTLQKCYNKYTFQHGYESYIPRRIKIGSENKCLVMIIRYFVHQEEAFIFKVN